MSTYARFQELKHNIEFGNEEAELLRSAHELVAGDLDDIVEHFYSVIEKSPQMRSLFDGPDQIQRQKVHLRKWLEGLFGGEYDEAYFQTRANIGRVHVRIGMDQSHMFSMMNVLRIHTQRCLQRGADRAQWSAERRRALIEGFHKLVDVELAIMIETYREHYEERIRDHARLSTLGQLAASIGHELRNPLAVIETSVHLIRRRASDDDDRIHKHVDKIAKQVAVSGQIITDLLELARDRPPVREPTALQALVSEAVASIDTKGVEVSIEISTKEPAHVDGSQVRQVVSNLVQNSAQAITSMGDRDVESLIEVVVRKASGDLIVEVIDNGPGLSREVLPRLFEPLVTTRAKGVGLGLALCRRIAQKHDGTISGTTRADGGAHFVLTIPQAFEA